VEDCGYFLLWLLLVQHRQNSVKHELLWPSLLPFSFYAAFDVAIAFAAAAAADAK
jgi:hypothetical protein